MEKHPHELHLILGADRGAQYPCPECGTLCKAHDFQDMTWRHLNFFQHLCFLTASVPRVDCPEHGIHRAKVPWARAASSFTTLFEQVVMSLAREMPVNAISRHVSSLLCRGFAKQTKVRSGLFQQAAKGTRWASLKGDMARMDEQRAALAELEQRGLHTATAFRIKELLRWVREADTKQGA